MPWNLVQYNYTFYFQEQSQDGVSRDRIHRLVRTLQDMDDPSEYVGLFSCELHQGRHVAKIPDSRKLLFFEVHGDDDEQELARHSLELIAILDPDNLL